MYAIVDIAGQQFKVKKDEKVYVHRLDANEGANLEFDNVLLLDNNGKITVGTPSVEGVRIAAKVLTHVKGDKVIVFKKKRRKGYQKSNGHRQQFSQILIQGILAKGETFKAEDAKPVKAKKEVASAEVVEKPTAVKKAAPKKVTAEKTVKAEAEKPAKKAAAPKKTTKTKE